MANIVKPTGFRPVDHLLGGAWSGKIMKFCIPQSDTHGYWEGRPVKLAAGSDAYGVPYVTTVTAGSEATDICCGVIQAISPVLQEGAISFQGTPLTTERIPIPATKDRDWYVFVNIDPFVIYEGQFDNTTTLTAAAANKNASYSVADGASSILSYDGTTLLGSSVAASASLPIQLLGLSQNTATNTFGKAAIFRFIFNTHQYKQARAGV